MSLPEIITSVFIVLNSLSIGWLISSYYDQRKEIERLKRENSNLQKFNKFAVDEVKRLTRNRDEKGRFIK